MDCKIYLRMTQVVKGRCIGMRCGYGRSKFEFQCGRKKHLPMKKILIRLGQVVKDDLTFKDSLIGVRF